MAFFIHFSQRAGNLLRLSCVSARYRVACIQSVHFRIQVTVRNHSFQDEYSLRHLVILNLIRTKINAPPAFKSHYRSNIGIKLGHGAQYVVFLHVRLNRSQTFPTFAKLWFKSCNLSLSFFSRLIRLNRPFARLEIAPLLASIIPHSSPMFIPFSSNRHEASITWFETIFRPIGKDAFGIYIGSSRIQICDGICVHGFNCGESEWKGESCC